MAATQSTYEKGSLYQLPLPSLIPDPKQPRKFFDEQALGDFWGDFWGRTKQTI